MNQKRLLGAIQSLFDAETPEEFNEILSRHPELLDEETLRSLAMRALSQGDIQTMMALEQLLHMLSSVGHGLEQQETERLEVEPATAQTPVSWTRMTREYLVRREDGLLDEAMNSARRAGERDIVTLLQYYRKRDQERIDQLAEKLAEKLFPAGRREEAMTIGLVGLDIRANMVDMYMYFPAEHHAQILRAAVESCGLCAEYARRLGDQACRALYLGLQAEVWTHL